MDNETTTPAPQPEGQNVSPADGKEAGSSGLTLSELNQVLGKEFKDKESALKSLKDTNEYVGKAKQELKKAQESVNPQLVDEVQKLKASYQQDRFYTANPDYNQEEVKEILGDDPAKALENPKIKKAVEAIAAHYKSEKSKSVIHSNPRLGQAVDSIAQAREAANKGDFKGANKTAIDSVLKAYDL
jgi:hypothetical protein